VNLLLSPTNININLSEEELNQAEKMLGRKPNSVELGMIDVMWSEHCSYKSSKLVLKKLPTKGKRVIVGPGYDSGIVDLRDGDVAAFKIESHNHPSAIEPYNGAATGIGGIIRDILCTNCRPIGLLDSLRFGELRKGHNRWLFLNVVRGIADYGNCCGIPTVAGEIEFDESFESNCLVNVACVGIGRKENIVLGRMENPGDNIVLLGGSTGRDGIHGVTFASKVISDGSEEDRPSVQVGDPFTKKVVIEATLEALKTGYVRGLKDLGGGGLTCGLSEMSSKGGVGVEIDIDKIHVREGEMTPYEIMISESQERMLFAIMPEGLNKILNIFKKWEIPYSVIGRVTDTCRIIVKKDGSIVVSIPPEILTDAPAIKRKSRKPGYLKEISNKDGIKNKPKDISLAVYTLLKTPNIASKEFVFRQYDHEVGVRTINKPGDGDAAVLRLLGKNKAIAIKSDCNSFHSYLDPFYGHAGAVAESIRNLVAVGSEPIAIVDCCNFGNPEDPEIYWQFEKSIDGLVYMLKGLGIPCVGGNVSFYNEDDRTRNAVKPTIVIVSIGLIGNLDWITKLNFKEEGDSIIAVGKTFPEMGGSQYYLRFKGIGGRVPRTTPEKEKSSIRAVQTLIQNGYINSAHDCSKGGLAIALATMAINGEFGAELNLDQLPKASASIDELMFSESHARFIVTSKKEDVNNIIKLCRKNNVPAAEIGEVTETNSLSFKYKKKIIAKCEVDKMKKCWEEAIPRFVSPTLKRG
jgi:phosphoribosylformylglycinamidine synthase II